MEKTVSPSEHRAMRLSDAAKHLSTLFRSEEEIPVQKLQSFRKKEEYRLKLWHRGGGGGKEIACRRSDLVDILFKEIFQHAVHKVCGGEAPPKLTASAFGGYGRRELNPLSDVDVTFIHAGEKPSPQMEKFITAVLMVLWDLGFKVGHATRSVRGCIAKANEDMVTKTAMLESRWLAGDKKLFETFRRDFEKACVRGKEKDYISWRLQNLKELRARYGASVFMQEPHIKSGCGGLRDYQNLIWTGTFHAEAGTPAKLVEKKILRERERKTLEEAHDFLLKVRTEMHYQTGRASDQLTLRLQGGVATALGYPQKNILKRCEEFMRDYYRHTRNIHLLTTLALGRISEERWTKDSVLTKLLSYKRTETIDEFVIRGREMFPKNREIFSKDPTRLMRAFQLMQTRNLAFSAELEDLIKRRIHLVDRTFQYSKENRTIFLSILSRKGEVGRVLREMHNLGFLGKYIPEFAPLTCLVQHEFYHRYTADEHTLLCIEKIDELLFATSQRIQPYAEIFRNLEDPHVLYLAMLLHDTGKAANTRNHEEASALAAQRAARRLQLPPARSKRLITLVDAHGALGGMARSRNLEDPATVEEFAGVIRDPVTLDNLMVLTLADGMGTSDEGWSDWKEQLVWLLYHQTKKYLADSAGFRKERQQRRIALLQEVREELPSDYAAEVTAHFEGMPERYMQFRDAQEICRHIRQFRRFFSEGQKEEGPHIDPVIEWRDHPEEGYAEVTLCGWDRERLLERIAAAFVQAGINVLGADIYTRGDQLALDTFRVTNNRTEPLPRERERKVFEKKLGELLAAPGNKPVPMPVPAKKTQPPNEEEMPIRVVFNNVSHPTCTLLEVQAPDRPGLLHQFLRAISHGGISIEAARIATESKAAIDVFYLRTQDGKKIMATQTLQRLERRLRAAANRAASTP